MSGQWQACGQPRQPPEPLGVGCGAGDPWQSWRSVLERVDDDNNTIIYVYIYMCVAYIAGMTIRKGNHPQKALPELCSYVQVSQIL